MSKHSSNTINEEGLILSGYQKKLKTMKKKFFVLYKDTLRNAARLEYYDNDRKFKAGLPPKRVIKLKNCFNINRRLDTKYEFVIALSTKDGSFGIVFETEYVMLQWLEDLIALQRDKNTMAEPMQPHFEHVWQVSVQRKGLAENKGIVGNYHVCLTPKSLTFITIGTEKSTSGDTRIPKIEFLLTTIRRCGDSQCFFYMEVGRQSVIGPGELWMETEDSLIAQNMHRMILSAMSAKNETNLEPMRKRSSSANEASKPINVIQRRQTQTDIKGNSSPQASICYGRERCDSLPTRNRTSSECSNQSFTIPSAVSMRNNPVHRSQSYQRHSNSPPMSSVMGCSESEESSISIDEPDENGTYVSYRNISDRVIPEENTEELINSESKSSDNLSQIESETLEENYITMAPLRNYKELDEYNNTNQKQFTKSRDDSKCMPLNCGQYDHSAKLEFAEYTSDNVSKISTNDLNTQTDNSLPTRTYSIGSRFEHNKLNKRIGNLNSDSEQQTTMRVRAFSVGSRAKIPRCDLQRGILFPNVIIKEQQNFNSNSNNNISVADTAVYNTLLHNIDTSQRDKKSTSAPLLIHKSQNSVDRMSDLMEIDFSKGTTTTSPLQNIVGSQQQTHRVYQPPQQQHTITKMPFGKSAVSLPTTVANPNYDFNRSNRFESAAMSLNPSNQRDSPPNHVDSESNSAAKAQTDNGYLEMKPVGGGGGGGSSSSVGIFAKNSTNLNHISSSRYLGGNPANIVNTNTIQSTTSEHLSYIPKIADSNAVRNSNIVQANSRPHQQTIMSTISANKLDTLETKHNSMPGNKYINNDDVEPNNKDDTTEKSINHRVDATKRTTRGIETTNFINNKIISLNAINNLSSKFAQINFNVTESRENKTNASNMEDTNRRADENILTNYTTLCKNNSLSQRSSKQRLDNAMHSTNDEGGGGNSSMTGVNANNILDRESGYEILQIKSDSSLLQGNKNSNRPSSIRKQQQQQQSHLLLNQQNQMKTTKSQPMVTTTSSNNITTSNNCNNTILTSQSLAITNPNCMGVGTTSRNITSNHKLQQSPFNASTAAPVVPSSSATMATAASSTMITTLSRPPSVSSEHGLYYASLDLPQSSGEITTKSPKGGGDPLNESSPVNIPDVNNSYAKIDFDHHSDSSSSSSKNMNI